MEKQNRRDRKEEIKVLEDLLEDTKDDDTQDYNFDKITELIEKAKEMKKEEKLRSQRTNDYFQQLKEKLSESTAFLNRARKDLDNMQEMKVQKLPEINSVQDYETLMKKSDEEIQEEMNHIRAQLDVLDSRVRKFNQKTKTADEFYTKSLETLKAINQNLHGDHTENA